MHSSCPDVEVECRDNCSQRIPRHKVSSRWVRKGWLWLKFTPGMGSGGVLVSGSSCGLLIIVLKFCISATTVELDGSVSKFRP